MQNVSSKTLDIAGVILEINALDKGGTHYNQKQHIEEGVSTFFNKLKNTLHPEIVIDVGANYGFTASVFARELNPKKIIAIEPDEKTFVYLEKNTSQNIASEINVVLLQNMLGSRNNHNSTFAINPSGSQDNRVIPGGSN